MFASASAVVFFAAINRFWGAGFRPRSFIDRNHHKISFVLAVIASVVLFFYADRWAAILPWAWFDMRSVAYEDTGGSLTPNNFSEYFGTLARFCLPTIVFVAYAMLAEKNWGTIGAFYAYTCVANTCVSAVHGAVAAKAREDGRQLPGDLNTFVELFHGATYGLAVAFAVGWT